MKTVLQKIGNDRVFLTGLIVILTFSLSNYAQQLIRINSGDILNAVKAKFEMGFIDGLSIVENGNYLVSLWKGKVYRVTPQEEVTKILDTILQHLVFIVLILNMSGKGIC